MRALLRVLTAGFTVVFALFAAAAWIGVRNTRSLTTTAAAPGEWESGSSATRTKQRPEAEPCHRQAVRKTLAVIEHRRVQDHQVDPADDGRALFFRILSRRRRWRRA